MTAKLDYASWLTPERFAVEDELWTASDGHREWAKLVASYLPASPSILEVGCGPGLVLANLPRVPAMRYIGVDANPLCLASANARNPSRGTFIQSTAADFLRDYDGAGFDLFCAFAFFKHISLEEWPTTFTGLLRLARKAIVMQTIQTEPMDDGTEFIHAWQSPATVLKAIAEAGHRLVFPAELDTAIGTEQLLITERI